MGTCRSRVQLIGYFGLSASALNTDLRPHLHLHRLRRPSCLRRRCQPRPPSFKVFPPARTVVCFWQTVRHDSVRVVVRGLQCRPSAVVSPVVTSVIFFLNFKVCAVHLLVVNPIVLTVTPNLAGSLADALTPSHPISPRLSPTLSLRLSPPLWLLFGLEFTKPSPATQYRTRLLRVTLHESFV